MAIQSAYGRSVFCFVTVCLLISSSAYASFSLMEVIPDSLPNAGTRGTSSCDANNDGILDLVIADIYAVNLSGQISFVNGLTGAAIGSTPNFAGPNPGGLFGTEMVNVGDLNADGFLDELIVSEPGNNAVYILDCEKAANGLSSSAITHTFVRPTGYQKCPNDQFGGSVAGFSKPLSNEKYIFIGAHAQHDDAVASCGISGPGLVTSYKIVTASAFTVSQVATLKGGTDGEEFGFDLTLGDINADLKADLGVSAPRFAGGEGYVRFYNGTTLFSGTPIAFSADLRPPVEPPGSIFPAGTIQPGQEFGTSLATGHSAGLSNPARVMVGARYYGVFDILSTTPLFAPQAGRVTVHSYNSSTNTWATLHNSADLASLSSTPLSAGPNHYWGYSVAAGGDTDGTTGSAALVIGGPGTAAATDSGRVVALLLDETNPGSFKLVDYSEAGAKDDQRGVNVSCPGILSDNNRPAVTYATPVTGSTTNAGYTVVQEVPDKAELTTCTSGTTTGCNPSAASTNAPGCAASGLVPQIAYVGQGVDPNTGAPTIGIPWVGSDLKFSLSGFPAYSVAIVAFGYKLGASINISSSSSYSCLLATFPFQGLVYSVPIDGAGNGSLTMTAGANPILIPSFTQASVFYVQAVVKAAVISGFSDMSNQLELKIW